VQRAEPKPRLGNRDHDAVGRREVDLPAGLQSADRPELLDELARCWVADDHGIEAAPPFRE
jgi:hypothetical protein